MSSLSQLQTIGNEFMYGCMSLTTIKLYGYTKLSNVEWDSFDKLKSVYLSDDVDGYKDVPERWKKEAKYNKRKSVFAIRELSHNRFNIAFSVWNVMTAVGLFL